MVRLTDENTRQQTELIKRNDEMNDTQRTAIRASKNCRWESDAEESVGIVRKAISVNKNEESLPYKSFAMIRLKINKYIHCHFCLNLSLPSFIGLEATATLSLISRLLFIFKAVLLPTVNFYPLLNCSWLSRLVFMFSSMILWCSTVRNEIWLTSMLNCSINRPVSNSHDSDEAHTFSHKSKETNKSN